MKNTLTVRWKKYDSTEYYSFNPETGVLYILVNMPQHKGYHVRTDGNAGELMRKYHAELVNRVPEEYREFEDCTPREYADVWTEVVNFTNDAFRTTLYETF